MNLIIDISNLFCKSYAIFKSFKPKQLVSKEEERAILIRKFFNDFFFSINKFDKIDSIICCFDSKSFRKKINTSYKLNRTTKDVDFYEILDEIKYILMSKGFIVSKIDNLEADDLMYLWRNKLSNCYKVMLSTDEDIRQLLDSNTIVYGNATNINTIYHSSNSSIDLSVFKGIKILLVDPKYIVFKKILLGDKSDNIERCVPYGIGEIKLKKLFDSLISNGIKFTLDNIVKHIECKLDETKMIENYQLTYLSDKFYDNDTKSNIDLYFSQNHTYTYKGFLNTKELLIETKYFKA